MEGAPASATPSRVSLPVARSTIVPVLGLLFVALTLGLAFAHVLESVGKVALDGTAWLTVQQTLYVAFGPIGGACEVLAIVLAWWSVALRRRGTAPWSWSLCGAIAVSAGVVVWATVVSPMNGVLNAWTPETLPDDWMRVRNRWELGHALHAFLFVLAFVSLTMAHVGSEPVRAGDAVVRPHTDRGRGAHPHLGGWLQ